MNTMYPYKTRNASSRMTAGWTRMHGLVAGTVLFVVLLMVVLLIAGAKKVQMQGNMLKASGNCRAVLLALERYAVDHGGVYPSGADANQALRELFKQGYATDERDFSCPFSFGKADNNIGQSPNFDNALTEGENHWAMTKGVNAQSLALTPLLFENPVSTTWPPRWSLTDANKPVPGRAWEANEVPPFMRRDPLSEWTGYGVFIGHKDGSVSIAALGKAEDGTATVVPDAAGRNIFEQAGPHEVLGVAKGPAPSSAVEEPIAQSGPKMPGLHEVFTSTWNAKNKLRIISDSECEVETENGVFVATYTYEGKQMRFVLNAFGSQMVGYADVYSDGIVMRNQGFFKNGEALLNPEGLRLKAEEDRAAQIEAQQKAKRIGEEAPKLLIGLWKEIEEPKLHDNTTWCLFRADGTWTTADLDHKQHLQDGRWRVNGDVLYLTLTMMGSTVGTFESKILELTSDTYVRQSSGPVTVKTTSTRVNDTKNAVGEKTTVPASAPNESAPATPMPAVTNDSGGAENPQLAKLIIGGWNHHTRYIEYFEGGKYVNHPRRGDDETGRWKISGNSLTQIPDNGPVSMAKIVSLDAKELALNFGEHEPTLYFTRTEDSPVVQMPTNSAMSKAAPAEVKPATSDAKAGSSESVPFLDCTLTYISHTADWDLYFGNEAKGLGVYQSKMFSSNGGAAYSGDLEYVIEAQGDSKWKIMLMSKNSKDVPQEIIFWITEGDINSNTLSAVGNVYDSSGQPMWPGSEKIMQMRFTRGKHLRGSNNPGLLNQRLEKLKDERSRLENKKEELKAAQRALSL